MNNKRQMHVNELEQNHMSRFLAAYSSLCQSSFIHHSKRYLLPGERWWWHKTSKQEGWLNTYISFCVILTNDTKTTTERKKKKKFSKPTKKMGEELAAKKRCQQNFGSSEIEYRRKLKSTLAARGQRPWESGHFTICLKRHRNCRYQTALNCRAGLTI